MKYELDASHRTPEWYYEAGKSQGTKWRQLDEQIAYIEMRIHTWESLEAAAALKGQKLSFSYQKKEAKKEMRSLERSRDANYGYHQEMAKRLSELTECAPAYVDGYIAGCKGM